MTLVLLLNQASGIVEGLVSPINMTSNNTPAPYVVSVSSVLGGGYDPYFAFDGTPSYTHSATPLPWWIKIDLGSLQAVGSYKLTSRYDGVFHEWVDWILEGSNNDSTWTLADTVVGELDWAPAQTRTYQCDVPGNFRYWRWTVSKSTSGVAPSSGYAEVSALELYASISFIRGRIDYTLR